MDIINDEKKNKNKKKSYLSVKIYNNILHPTILQFSCFLLKTICFIFLLIFTSFLIIKESKYS
jgi:hypothetical protein